MKNLFIFERIRGQKGSKGGWGGGGGRLVIENILTEGTPHERIRKEAEGALRNGALRVVTGATI